MGLIEAAKKDRDPEAAQTAMEVVEAMVEPICFPSAPSCGKRVTVIPSTHVNGDATEHLRERRVAHEHVFRQYLERVDQPGVAGVS